MRLVLGVAERKQKLMFYKNIGVRQFRKTAGIKLVAKCNSQEVHSWLQFVMKETERRRMFSADAWQLGYKKEEEKDGQKRVRRNRDEKGAPKWDDQA